MCKIVNLLTGEELNESIKLADNSILKVKPELFMYWNFEKNNEIGLDIYKVTKGLSKKAWWYCPNCDDNYPMSINKKVIGRGCSICSGYYVTKKNSFGGKHPEIAKEWHPVKNEKTPYEYSRGSGYRAWWICPNCNEEYDMPIDKRTCENAKCPYCRGLRVGISNCLATKNPELVKHWHPTKNGDLTPYDVSYGHHNYIWWKCPDCGDETYTKLYGKHGCEVCAGQKIKVGYNDMWTTNPQLASMLLNPDDGYKYMEQSNQKVDWKCPNCENIIKNKTISDIRNRGLSCPRCSDGLSFGERFMYTLLKELNIEFLYDQSQKWSNKCRYDFFIVKNNNVIIIEIQGEQHSNGSFGKMGGRSLKEEQENDKYKRELALKNGVTHYIEIDSREMNFNYIKENILNSSLVELFNIEDNTIDNIKLHINSKLTVKCWELWNSGDKSVMSISNKLSISKRTTRKYLILGNSIGKCSYDVKNRYDNIKRPVVKLSMNADFLEEYESIAEAARSNNIKHTSTIGKVCREELKHAYNFIWMYRENYEEFIKQQNKELQS